MRTKKGTVTSAKMTGTVKVTVDTTVFHPIYKKRFKRSKSFLADSNGHDLYEGDVVVISECRPLSKRKRFTVSEIVQKADRVSELQEEAGVRAIIGSDEKKTASQAAS